MSESAPKRWTKATKSIGLGACVELSRDDDLVALRNSRHPDVQHSFTLAEFAAFLDGAKNGEFDHLVD